MTSPVLNDPKFQHGIRKTLYERNFYDFVKAAWVHIDNDPYIDNFHIYSVCIHLQAVFEGKINRILITVPPGCGKSLLVNVLFPAWCWTRDPKKRIINTSFAFDQSTRDTVKSRRLIAGEWYQSYWPIALEEDQNQKSNYANVHGGAREAKPYSNITGSRANIVIVDDPQSAEQANSAAERATANRIFWTAVQSRLNNLKKDAIICIMQRLHEDDVAGNILAKNVEKTGHGVWQHLCIPMEYDGNSRETCIGWKDPRTKPGELMFPELFPRDAVDALKIDLGPFAYAGQHQQDPAPDGDGFFRKTYFHTYGALPCKAEVDGVVCGQVHHLPKLRKYMTSDHAPGGKSTSDYNVIRIWGVDSARNLYLLDSFREKCTMDVAMGIVRAEGRTLLASAGALPLIARHKPFAWFAENDNTWKSIAPQVRVWMMETNTPCAIHLMPTAGDKMTKAQPYQAKAALGQVYLPDNIIGETALLEYVMFPVGKHDDQVDADGMIARAVAQAHPAITSTTDLREVKDDYEAIRAQDDDEALSYY